MTSPSETEGFDLTPELRILSMLGGTNLALWRCIAEPADDSIDGWATRAGPTTGRVMFLWPCTSDPSQTPTSHSPWS